MHRADSQHPSPLALSVKTYSIRILASLVISVPLNSPDGLTRRVWERVSFKRIWSDDQQFNHWSKGDEFTAKIGTYDVCASMLTPGEVEWIQQRESLSLSNNLDRPSTVKFKKHQRT